MTKSEYAEYEVSVKDFFERNDLQNLSTKCPDSEGDPIEPYFSWQPCECCGSSLGGDRYDCDGYSPTHGVLEFSVCTDCVYYAEYGQLDDMTMMEVEESE